MSMRIVPKSDAKDAKSTSPDADSFIRNTVVPSLNSKAKVLFSRWTKGEEPKVLVIDGEESVVFGNRIPDIKPFEQLEKVADAVRACKVIPVIYYKDVEKKSIQVSNECPCPNDLTLVDPLIVDAMLKLSLNSRQNYYVYQRQHVSGRLLRINVKDDSANNRYDIKITHQVIQQTINVVAGFSNQSYDIAEQTCDIEIPKAHLADFQASLRENNSVLLSFLVPSEPAPEVGQIVIEESDGRVANYASTAQHRLVGRVPTPPAPSAALATSAATVDEPTESGMKTFTMNTNYFG